MSIEGSWFVLARFLSLLVSGKISHGSKEGLLAFICELAMLAEVSEKFEAVLRPLHYEYGGLTLA